MFNYFSFFLFIDKEISSLEYQIYTSFYYNFFCQLSKLNSNTNLKLKFLYVVLGLIGLIVILWLRDLCILGSLLDTTTVEMTSTNAMVPNEWSEPWACFLNNDEEASMAVQLLHQFSRSYRVHDRSRH